MTDQRRLELMTGSLREAQYSLGLAMGWAEPTPRMALLYVKQQIDQIISAAGRTEETKSTEEEGDFVDRIKQALKKKGGGN
jgi:hypothetical protein